MIYQLARPVARYVLGYYLGRIEVTGLENIPSDAAVILAANHPTAFIEPCILACYQPRPLWFLARGDLYKNRFATAVLRGLHILPVYRIEDGGYGKLRENFATFGACHRALSRRRALMILAEGRCIHEKKLRPLRKGTARIALGTLEADPTLPEVYVVPVGVNFTKADSIDSDVFVHCGTPILASTFMEEYRQRKNQSVRALTDRLRERLEALVVHNPLDEWEAAREVELEVMVNERGRLFNERGELSLPKGFPGENMASARYAALLRELRINDQTVQDFMLGKDWRSNVYSRQLRPFVRLLLAFLCQIPQFPIWAIGYYLAETHPGTVEFFSPVRFAAIAVGTLLYVPALIFLPWCLKLWLVLSLITVSWARTQGQGFIHWRNRRRLLRMVPERRKVLTDLRAQVLAGLPGS